LVGYLGRIDLLQVKHEVTDEYAVEKTHPVFYNLAEQWQGFTEYFQDLPPRHFVLKVRAQKVKIGKTLNLPKPRVDPQELLEVEQEYLHRYFRSKQEIASTAERREQALRQSVSLFPSINQSTSQLANQLTSQPINRRERLR
jgi:hypothetical protein